MVSTDIWGGYLAFGIGIILSVIFVAADGRRMLGKSYRTLPEARRGSAAAA
jgi:hypothetical protein